MKKLAATCLLLTLSMIVFAARVIVPAPGFSGEETYQQGHTQKGSAVATCEGVGNVVPIANQDFNKICKKADAYMVQCAHVYTKASNGVSVPWHASVTDQCVGNDARVTVGGPSGLTMYYHFPNGVGFGYTPEIPSGLRGCHYAKGSDGFLTCQG